MKVFVSWSGERSKAVAIALKQWLPDVLQDAEAWMSEHDLDAGVRWAHNLSAVLEEARMGIICLTPENQTAPWLLFEAGALSKSVQEARLIPYLIAMSPSDVRSPLSQFQCVAADKAGTRKLLDSVNATLESPLPLDRLDRLFDKWWPDLESRVRDAEASTVVVQGAAHSRGDREVLNEMLELVRSVAQSQAASADSSGKEPRGSGSSIQADPERQGTPTEGELRALLAEHHGNVAAVGRLFGKERMQVHRWMDRYGIAVDDYR